jgi:shikimate kinase
MGTGKSHISNILSSKLNFKLFDLDKEISEEMSSAYLKFSKNTAKFSLERQKKKL